MAGSSGFDVGSSVAGFASFFEARVLARTGPTRLVTQKNK